MSLQPAKWLANRILTGNVVVFSGAGISTESGVPDFRSAAGLWKKYDPSVLATTDALATNYKLFREFYQMRINGLNGVLPNAGHNIIAEWEKRQQLKAVITQNVDGLHQTAGSQNVVELHGRLTAIRCEDCSQDGNVEDFMNDKECKKCGGRLRPGVVLFGEMLNEDNLDKANELAANCSTFIVLGSSLVVSPANMYPRLAKRKGAALAIINRDPTDQDDIADVVVHSSIGEFLTETENEIQNILKHKE